MDVVSYVHKQCIALRNQMKFAEDEVEFINITAHRSENVVNGFHRFQ